MKLSKLEKKIINKSIELIDSGEQTFTCNAIKSRSIRNEFECNHDIVFKLVEKYNKFYIGKFLNLSANEVERGLDYLEAKERRVIMLSLFLAATS